VGNCLQGGNWLYYLSIFDPTRASIHSVRVEAASNPTLQSLNINIFGNYLKIATTGNKIVIINEDPFGHNSFINMLGITWNDKTGQYDC
jgi:hypothetical protein